MRGCVSRKRTAVGRQAGRQAGDIATHALTRVHAKLIEAELDGTGYKPLKSLTIVDVCLFLYFVSNEIILCYAVRPGSVLKPTTRVD
jgi:hypothetical protein